MPFQPFAKSLTVASFVLYARFSSSAFSLSVGQKISTQQQGQSSTSILKHNNFSVQQKINQQTSLHAEKKTDNVFQSFVRTFNFEFGGKIETEGQRKLRLKQERLAIVAKGEILRTQQVKKDALPYLALLSMQFLPLLGSNKFLSITYFFVMAVGTVFVGGRQQTIDKPEIVSKESAIYAPFGASISIGILYLLLKFSLDPTTLYAIGVSLIGALAISDIGVPILQNSLPSSLRETEIPLAFAKNFGVDSTEKLPLDGILALIGGIICVCIYWSPIDLTQKFIVSNFLAWALAMVSLGSISLGTFQTGAILLSGLFFYDIFFVFGTDIMITVATKIEAPVKFLYPSGLSNVPYPFSVLGLGDIVIPGLFVRFMSQMDKDLQPPSISYFDVTTLAYAIGLLSCFAINNITGAGQPALLYLVPACVGGALAAGAWNSQLSDVWSFEESKENDS